jgi:hypothetical protein
MSTAERAVEPTTACPWIGYDDQSERTIIRFVTKSSPSQALAVAEYERANGGREGVIAAAERRTAKWDACQ